MTKQTNLLFLLNFKKIKLLNFKNTILCHFKKNFILNSFYDKLLLQLIKIKIEKTIIINLYNCYFYLLNKITIKQFEYYTQVKKNEILNSFIYLKSNKLYQFFQLIDIFVYDTPGKTNRFTLIYSLLSIQYNSRINISFKTNEIEPISSVTKIFKSAYWIEREVWDMFGILFINHNDLRRILTDYNFNGHPLRKDFPLSGFIDIFYDEKEKRLSYVPIELSQEYRSFSFISSW